VRPGGADGPDVNGDGVEDRPNSGEVYIIFGRRDFFFGGKFNICAREQDITIFGASASDTAGAALAINNLDRDSFADLLIGAPLATSTNGAATGKAYAILGKPFLWPVFPS